ncbi:uncharacterized protein LOC133718343 isoform X2 [Rosa rugosa]|uniref:uncharacterized protein LOC133718343 isoform X2 n=1 Tax=Rosa rugosa TaxID=74645 RepID=UPI002B401B4C|nr:uncharacterized protein LOC133718343 isoform X2 [Rosa rugosa]
METKCRSTDSRLQDPPLKIDPFEPDEPSEICSSSTTTSAHAQQDSRLAKEIYFKVGVPLHNAAQRGDWKAARRIIKKYESILRARITKGGQTVLHISAGARHVRFVKKLLKLLDDHDLAIQDLKGNTAFTYAVAAGSRRVAEMMILKNPSLPTIRGGQGMSTLYTAAAFGRGDIAWLLYPKLIKVIDEAERTGIFFTFISHNMYELAFRILNDYPALAFARDDNHETALHLLAQKPSAFSTKTSAIWRVLVYSCTKQNGKLAKVPGLQLLKCLLNQVLRQNDSLVNEIIRMPSHVMFMATKLGNSKFVAELIDSHPDLIWETDECNRTIFHIAVMYHHASIFNLVHKLGVYKEFVLSFKDDQKNNILHLAAKLVPGHQLSNKSRHAIQMRGDLLWFEYHMQEVQKVVPPWYAERRNLQGQTPRDIFYEEHNVL